MADEVGFEPTGFRVLVQDDPREVIADLEQMLGMAREEARLYARTADDALRERDSAREWARAVQADLETMRGVVGERDEARAQRGEAVKSLEQLARNVRNDLLETLGINDDGDDLAGLCERVRRRLVDAEERRAAAIRERDDWQARACAFRAQRDEAREGDDLMRRDAAAAQFRAEGEALAWRGAFERLAVLLAGVDHE